MLRPPQQGELRDNKAMLCGVVFLGFVDNPPQGSFLCLSQAAKSQLLNKKKLGFFCCMSPFPELFSQVLLLGRDGWKFPAEEG